MFWEPFDPVSYFLHTILGSLGIIAAVVALASVKGSRRHVLMGRVFAIAAFVAAGTAIVFGLTRFSGAALASSVMTFSALAAALLVLKPRSTQVRLGEYLTTVAMALAFLWLMMGFVSSLSGEVFLLPLLYAVFPFSMLVGDLRYLRLDDAGRLRARLPRHYSRMGFALAVAVHAPIVSFSSELGLSPPVAFFGPLLLWPALIIYFGRKQKRGGLVTAS